jgi:hypothetical protein
MEPKRFDGWTKAFVTADRRQLLGGLFGILALR